ncbi:carboxylesterase/lipase family protein [Gorillibacterium sp. sgz500922]|uniref:carboxylesterase/lipase family protein n=1 Tax=Gorillibacterium sp. sgz500922 TaxID=3446694 RepID=UPI003F66D834
MNQQTVNTRQGWVQGYEQAGVRVWRGIPYAEPPVGALRFRAPQKPAAWEGVRPAAEPGPIAMQAVVKDSSRMSAQASEDKRSEDCLYLNIWAPLAEGTAGTPAESAQAEDGNSGDEAAAGSLKPVLVWLHGGAFVSGAGSLPLYDGTSFVRSGEVVVVTVNYRLGAFGFLHLAPFGGGLGSNVGMLDQVAALEWVRDNIAAFGGDPERVTVFGESAGAMSIAALLAMPAAKGLFRRAILQSGATQYLPAEAASRIAQGFLAELKATGRGTAPTSEPGTRRNAAATGILEEEAVSDKGENAAVSASASKAVPADAQADIAGWLEAFSAEELQEAAERLSAKLNPHGLGPMVFQPALDGATLPLDPTEAVRAGSAAGVELLVGTNRDEGAYFIRQGAPVLKREQTVGLLQQFGLGPKAAELANGYEVSNDGQAELVTDLIFWGPAVRLAEAQLPHGRVWMYRFDWSYPGHPLIGKSVHTLEIMFVFNNLFYLEKMGGRIDAAAEALARRMQEAWIRFAVREGGDVADWEDYGLERRFTRIFDIEDGWESDPQAVKRPLLV